MKRSDLLIFPVVLLVSFTFLGGHLYSPDEEILFRMTEALAERGSLAVTPLGGFATRAAQPAREDGREYAQYGIGQPLAAVPFYFMGKALSISGKKGDWVRLHRRLPTDYPMEGAETEPFGGKATLQDADVSTRFALSLFNAFVIALSALTLLLIVFEAGLGRKAAWLAALAWALGTMALPHGRTFFTEPLAGLCVLLAFYGLLLYQNRRRWFFTLAAGFFAGWACLTRMDSLFLLPGLFLFLWMIHGDRESILGKGFFSPFGDKEFWAALAGVVFPLALTGFALLLMNQIFYGHFFSTGYSDQTEGVRFSTPLLIGLHGFLFSVGKGLFFFSPVLLPALWGIGPAFRKGPALTLALGLSVVAFLIFQSCWQNWAGGWCWGPRHIFQIHALLALFLAFWIDTAWTPLRRILFSVLFVLSLAVQIYGSSQNFIHYYRLYFQNPEPPSATLLYDMQANHALRARYAIYLRNPRTGQPEKEILPSQLPAPINDSIYIVQNSQWHRYKEMARLGMHDFFWLHLLTPNPQGE